MKFSILGLLAYTSSIAQALLRPISRRMAKVWKYKLNYSKRLELCTKIWKFDENVENFN
jgi:hypothetical protein